MKYLSVANLKGGVGKTSFLFNLSSMLANNGYKILVVDCDAQANLTSNFGIDDTVVGLKTVADIIESRIKPEEVVVKSPLIELPTLDVIPSSLSLHRTEFKIVNVSGREFILRNYFKENQEFFQKYDYIFFDTNPSLNGINIATHYNAEGVILVSDIGKNSLKGIQMFNALWGEARYNLNKEDNVTGFVINRYDKRIRMSKEYEEHCKNDEEIIPILFSTKIPENVKLREAELESKPIAIYDKKCTGYEAYNKIILEMKMKGVL